MPADPDRNDSNEPKKKKRRQNVACDSCKLRRIKCDLLTLLSPSEEDASPSSIPPPLHVLVARHPDVMCTNCVSKSLKCTTQQITNPVRPNKGGKRIEAARKMFGSDGSLARSPSDVNELQAQCEDHQVSMEVIEGNPMPDIRVQEPTGLTPFLQPEYLMSLSQDANQLNNFNPNSLTTAPNLTWPCDISTLPNMTQMTPISPPLQSSTAPVPSLQTAFHNPHGLAFASPIPQSQLEAHKLWTDTLTQIYPDQATPALPSKEPVPFTKRTVFGVNSPSPDMVFDSLREKFVPRQRSEMSKPFTYGSSSSGSSRHSAFSRKESPQHAENPFASRTPRSQAHLISRKRQRVESNDTIELFRDDDDPYGLWADEDKVVLRWSRREEVGERLADRSLGHQLSRHLIKVYFQAVHLSLPAISPESFYMEWQRAGERSDRMTPALEVLCVVIEAWASRYSDNPVILGLETAKAATAPKVITDGGFFTPGGQGRAHWGRARLHVCKALVERARKLIDYHGILRKPSVTGVQALALFSQLQNMSDTHQEANEHVMECELVQSTWLTLARMLHAAVIEQMKELELMWDSMGPIPVDPDELPISVGQLRMKQRRLFWTMMVSDALWSAASGQQPKVSDEDIESSGAWLLTVEDKLPPSTFKTLAFFMSCYHRLAVVARTIAKKLSIPNRRPGTVDVAEFSNRCRSIWRDIKDVYRDVSSNVEDLLAACDHDLLGFSPLSYIIHQIVTDQLQFRKTLNAGYIFEDTKGHSSPESSNIALLESLEKQSIDGVLAMARAGTHMIKSLHATAGSVFMRVLIATTQFLSEIPTNEQGYPPHTPGGSGWTWETKQEEIKVCTDALYQLGWAWADVGEVLDHLMVTMERMQPSLEELAEWTKASINRNQAVNHVANQRKRDIETDGRVMKAALAFWPPTSVPDLVDKWKQGEAFGALPSSVSEMEKTSYETFANTISQPNRQEQSRSQFGLVFQKLFQQQQQPDRGLTNCVPKQVTELDAALDAITGPDNEIHHNPGERVVNGLNGRPLNATSPMMPENPDGLADTMTLATGIYPGYDAVTDWTKFVNTDTPDFTSDWTNTAQNTTNTTNSAPGSSHSSSPNSDPNYTTAEASLAAVFSGLDGPFQGNVLKSNPGEFFPTNQPVSVSTPSTNPNPTTAPSPNFPLNFSNAPTMNDALAALGPGPANFFRNPNFPGSPIDKTNGLNTLELFERISQATGSKFIPAGTASPMGGAPRAPIFNPSTFWQMDIPGRNEVAAGDSSESVRLGMRDLGLMPEHLRYKYSSEALTELELFIQNINADTLPAPMSDGGTGEMGPKDI